MECSKWCLVSLILLFLGFQSEVSLLNPNLWKKYTITFPYQLTGEVLFTRHVQCVEECAILCTFENCTMFEIDSITNLCSIYDGFNPGEGMEAFPEGVRVIYKRENACELSGYNYDKEEGLCLKAYSDLKTWDDALITCENDGGRLLVLDSALDIAFMQENNINSVYWIGLSDTVTEGIWKWIDGNNFYFNFPHVQFNNFDSSSIENRNNADCAVLSHSGNLYDNSCDRNMSYICEKPHLVSGHFV